MILFYSYLPNQQTPGLSQSTNLTFITLPSPLPAPLSFIPSQPWIIPKYSRTYRTPASNHRRNQPAIYTPDTSQIEQSSSLVCHPPPQSLTDEGCWACFLRCGPLPSPALASPPSSKWSNPRGKAPRLLKSIFEIDWIVKRP
ncbi:hypothetical protein EYC84_005701 [Monilinia fructicola]|uniref:Uncharacterized protein n=1 Tax=Monilinia fructicola TaxID=38448 RepID=A0A5M9JZV4_MONFR|nr:hypothetical protein EYC84_005701 [Monilinia fructicola]